MDKDLKVEILEEGKGAVSKAGDILTVHYIGTLEDGTEFDSSFSRNDPFEFHLGAGMVIEGWEKGMEGMKVGERRILTIPPKLGYGDMAIGSIPANSTLIFEVELLSIK